MDKVKVNHKIEPFSLINQHSIDISSEDLIKHNYVILYFYPKDNTPG